ncbi:hypothetical protein H4219_004709 [Mycoemilia scoparia]|uniref:Transcription factor CBF/NF-Y/archaeal histone domain-containing protein n=1 Tax=Mycoemilia scoparia TaxID=417184 RepID=A0A9W8DMD9_9FUNG|nr:hypothetical protein H4219_004709 [Mycoemilia scoparia]
MNTISEQTTTPTKNTGSSGSGGGGGGGGPTGTTHLPAARVKKIVKEDRDIVACSQDALFLISKATELFIESLMHESFEFSRLDKRKTVQYKDMAKAVQSIEPYDFLSDVIPPTVPIRKAVKEAEKKLVGTQKAATPATDTTATATNNVDNMQVE